METAHTNTSFTSKVMLLSAAVFLIISIFLPIWRIELGAPQYPEGLILLIKANALAGNVDIINGLNHYIGMKTLHANDFIEFTILPYIIGLFALFAFIAGISGKKRLLAILFFSFLAFGIIAMVDFWHWEYEYGHDLDPNAAIIVPGMAYQPPLIGFKQLLNFGAYSVPDIGGWLFISSGALILVAFLKEYNYLKINKMKMKSHFLLLTMALFFLSCGETKPVAAKLNSDNCDYCNMTISDSKFVAELITAKGKIYKFDDLFCLKSFLKENTEQKDPQLYVTNFEQPNTFLTVEDAVFVKSEGINSPMGGNTIALSNNGKAEEYSKRLTGQILKWDDLNK